LPLVAADFGSRSTIQLAVTLYLFSVAGGQLLHGPVSDKFGRRSTLLVSLGLYVAATAVAGWAAGITTLLIARIGQAVGGCGGLVLGRAIVRDSAAAGQAASRMALLTMVQSLAPGIGPAVGGFLGAWFGWRSIFAALVVLGVVTFGGVWLALPETAASRGIAGSGRMPGSYLALLRSRSFRGYMFGGAFTSTSFYASLTASPFIFTQMLHRPATKVGLYYLVVMSGVPIGSFAVSRLAPRVRLTLLLRVTSAIAVLGALLFFVAAASGMLNLATVLLPMILFSRSRRLRPGCDHQCHQQRPADDRSRFGPLRLYADGQWRTVHVDGRLLPGQPRFIRRQRSFGPASCSANTFFYAPPGRGPAPVADLGDRVCGRFGRGRAGLDQVCTTNRAYRGISEVSSLLLYLLATAPAEPPQADRRAAEQGQRGRLGDRL